MIVKVNKSEILPLLNKTQSIVEKRTSLQTLLNVLLEVSQKETSMEVISKNKYFNKKNEYFTLNGKDEKIPPLSVGSLKIFATNLEVGFIGRSRVFVDKPIRLAVNAKSLFEIIRELPHEEIFLISRENHWLQVQQGRSVFNIAGISPESFPQFPDFNLKKFISMDPLILKNMIEKTLYCVSMDDTRRNLNGVLFEKLRVVKRDNLETARIHTEEQPPSPSFRLKILKDKNESNALGEFFEQENRSPVDLNVDDKKEGSIKSEKGKIQYRMVAMSTHRLSFIEREIDNPLLENLNQVIIPKKGLLELSFFLDEAIRKDQWVSFFIDKTQVVVHLDKSFLMIHLINDRYPNYRRLIPENMKNEVIVSRSLLLSSLRRVAILCHKESGFVSLRFSEGKLELTSGRTELGSAREELEVPYLGDDVSIGFNVNYIMDTLKSIQDEKISLIFSDASSPGVIQPLGDVSQTSVIMPMSFPNYD